MIGARRFPRQAYEPQQTKDMHLVLIFHLLVISLMTRPALFRRSRKPAPTRDDAFAELFQALAGLYASAARMKPEWIERWDCHYTDELPPKYHFGNDQAAMAARDMRYAIMLLQRHRWKSVVQPLFAEYDERAWQAFVTTSAHMSQVLIQIIDSYSYLLMEDEQDWISSAIEQFDEANRLRLKSSQSDIPAHRLIAEGTYLPVYIGIQLSDRLIERLRFEAGELD